MDASYTIDFQPVGRRGQCPPGKSLTDCAAELGVGIARTCGGKGTCHSCRVQVLKGSVSEPTASERECFSPQELAEGWRLACQTRPTSDCTLAIPPSSMTTPQRTQVEGLENILQPEPAVCAYRLELPAPSLSDLRADAERVLENINRHHPRCRKIDINTLREFPPRLRSWEWRCQASVRGDEVIALLPPSARQLGLAVDLGTTKIAAYLVDLSNGQTLSARGIMNPQISYGEDIISRMTYLMETPVENSRLRDLVVEALNQAAVDLCDEAGAGVEEIVDMAVAGNTAMHHLFLGLPIRQLALSPYVPAVSDALDIKARDLGMNIAPGAYVYTLPNCRVCGRRPCSHAAGLGYLPGGGAANSHRHRHQYRGLPDR